MMLFHNQLNLKKEIIHENRMTELCTPSSLIRVKMILNCEVWDSEMGSYPQSIFPLAI